MREKAAPSKVISSPGSRCGQDWVADIPYSKVLVYVLVRVSRISSLAGILQ